MLFTVYLVFVSAFLLFPFLYLAFSFFSPLKLVFPLFLSELFSHFNFMHFSLIFAFLSLLYFFPLSFFSNLFFLFPSKTQNALDGNGEIYLFKIQVCAEVQSKIKQSL